MAKLLLFLNMKRVNVYLTSAVVLGLLVGGAARAQTIEGVAEQSAVETVSITSEVAVTVENGTVVSDASSTVETLEGVVIDAPKEVPSSLGLWWRGVRERVSIALTSDPVKKVERQIKFAEERIRIAEKIAEKSSSNPVAQAKAEEMIARAQTLMEQAVANKEALASTVASTTRAHILRNIAKHQENREKILDNIEKRLPEDRKAEFEAKRAEVASSSARLLNAINNENIPADVREHLQAVKNRIETTAELHEQFKIRREALIQSTASSSPEQVREALKNLQEERKDALEAVREEYKNTLERMKPEDRLGTSTEKRAEIRQEREERREDRREFRDDRREVAKDVAVSSTRRDIRNDIREVREDREELREDRQEIREDRREIREERRELPPRETPGPVPAPRQ